MVGQQNFEMGAVVSVVLLVPAVVAFTIDRLVQRRQVALLSSRAVPYAPKPSRGFDLAMLGYCTLIAVFILGILATCQYAALIKLWPYNLELGLKNYRFDLVDGGGWPSYWNSVRMALYTAAIGTVVVFLGAYVVEKARGFAHGRAGLHLLAMMPMAIPGMVLGLAYVFFFNDPANPLHVALRHAGDPGDLARSPTSTPWRISPRSPRSSRWTRSSRRSRPRSSSRSPRCSRGSRCRSACRRSSTSRSICSSTR